MRWQGSDYHRKKITKMTIRAFALRQRDSELIRFLFTLVVRPLSTRLIPSLRKNVESSPSQENCPVDQETPSFVEFKEQFARPSPCMKKPGRQQNRHVEPNDEKQGTKTVCSIDLVVSSLHSLANKNKQKNTHTEHGPGNEVWIIISKCSFCSWTSSFISPSDLKLLL